MVLTDREILVALAQGQLLVRPLPSADRLSSSSLDLTLGASIRIWHRHDEADGEPTILSPGDPNYRYSETARLHSRSLKMDGSGYVMKPGDFVLAWTEEYLQLPVHSRIAARVEGKSSLARVGIGIHVTAPTIHAGFGGQIQLEVFNLGPLQVRLVPGMPVCQMIFEQTLGTPEKGYQGQFSGQDGS